MAQQRRRKALNFDLSSAKLRELFGEKGGRKACSQIKSYLTKHGFEHRQWSGYASEKPMSYIEIYDIVGELVDECGWLIDCVNRFDATNIMAESDMIDAIAVVFDWVDQNIPERTPIIAQLASHDYGDSEGELSWYAVILERYGESESVQNELHVNFGFESFTEPLSLHFANKVVMVKDFARRHESSINIQIWANAAIQRLEHKIAGAIDEEERRGY